MSRRECTAKNKELEYRVEQGDSIFKRNKKKLWSCVKVSLHVKLSKKKKNDSKVQKKILVPQKITIKTPTAKTDQGNIFSYIKLQWIS